MSDIMLDPKTGDLDLSGFDLKIVTGKEAIAQRLRIRLRFFYSEWYLDRTFGIPYYQSVFQKPANAAILDAVFKDAILDTPGVLRLTRFTLDIDTARRELSVVFSVETEDGEVTIEEELP